MFFVKTIVLTVNFGRRGRLVRRAGRERESAGNFWRE